LQAVFGGREIFIPCRKKGTSYERIVQVIGAKCASLFVDHFKGEQIYVPTNDRDNIRALHAEIKQRHDKGENINIIAKTIKKPSTNYSARWIRQILNDQKTTQQELF
jgi:Mor family transcriptional regulator